MTQPFPANVKAGIQKAGTTSPPTENNVADDAGPGAGANPPAGSFAIPYLSQSGQIFYAPMQGRPGTKITAKTASPRYPTSSVSIAKTYLPTPKQTTTMTLSMTFSTDSHAHTVCFLSPSESRSWADCCRLPLPLSQRTICRNTWLVGKINAAGIAFLPLSCYFQRVRETI